MRTLSDILCAARLAVAVHEEMLTWAWVRNHCGPVDGTHEYVGLWNDVARGWRLTGTRHDAAYAYRTCVR